MKDRDEEANPIMTDAEVAAFFRIDVKTLQRRLVRPKPGEVDFRKASPLKIGGRRFWLRVAVYSLAEIAVRAKTKAKGTTRRSASGGGGMSGRPKRKERMQWNA